MRNVLKSLILVISVSLLEIVLSSTERTEHSLCSDNYSCIPLRQCDAKPDSIFYPCHSGLNLFCCPNEDIKLTDEVKNIARRSSFFPVECGVISLDDKITGGQDADFGQFPWMALLGYKQRSVPITEFLCGGTLITDRYVLSAAHCMVVSPSHKLSTVRFGEHYLNTEKDCYTIRKVVTVCADPYVDVEVETHTMHPEYNTKTLKNDIALIKTKESVHFTTYIQPICLPFERSLEKRSLVGQKFIISGWGKTDAKKLGGASRLQYAAVFVWDHVKCNQVMPPEVKNISDTQICANGRKQDACKGDSGGPMFNTTSDNDGNLRTFQLGIVSFASTITCGIQELPPIYTRVDKYLNWIVDTIVAKNISEIDSNAIYFENK